jgi:anaerobic selenocysteine-containing dehydrogenase
VAGKETGVPAKDVRALAREWGRKRVYLAPGGWGNGHGGACRNQTGIQWARVMVCLAAMQGLGKPGVNMGNLQWGCPVDFNFYFPGYTPTAACRATSRIPQCRSRSISACRSCRP